MAFTQHKFFFFSFFRPSISVFFTSISFLLAKHKCVSTNISADHIWCYPLTGLGQSNLGKQYQMYMIHREHLFDDLQFLCISLIRCRTHRKSSTFISEIGLKLHCIVLNPIECGGLQNPPLSKKKFLIFSTFPRYVNGVLETTFCSQITFGLAGRGQKWSKLA